MFARSLNGVDGVLDRLRWVLVLLCVAGTALAAAVSRVFARRVMAPVADLTAAAEHIEATGDLDRRIDGAGDDELGRLARRFNAMLDRLGASQAALGASLDSQRRLIADASHELRTPVTSLRTNAEVLRDGAGPQPMPSATRCSTTSSPRPRSSASSSSDIIELARDGDAAAPVEEIRLDGLVARGRRPRAPPRARRRVRDAGRAVRRRGARPDRLGRAVNNLLDNAAKHSPPGGVVEVTVVGGEVTVRDHGPGVAAADAPHVFDRFYRGAGARDRPGSGLGLAIVRQVAEAHGGTVPVEDAPGGGALFRLALPWRGRLDAASDARDDARERAAIASANAPGKKFPRTSANLRRPAASCIYEGGPRADRTRSADGFRRWGSSDTRARNARGRCPNWTSQSCLITHRECAI